MVDGRADVHVVFGGFATAVAAGEEWRECLSLGGGTCGLGWTSEGAWWPTFMDRTELPVDQWAYDWVLLVVAGILNHESGVMNIVMHVSNSPPANETSDSSIVCH